jgi:hypothetical protein
MVSRKSHIHNINENLEKGWRQANPILDLK